MATVPTTRRSDDQHIIDTLYRRYYRTLKARYRRRLSDPQQADDCAQEVFKRAFERGKLANVRSLYAYLDSIARNLGYEVAREARSEREVLTVSSPLAELHSEHPIEHPPGMSKAELEMDLAKIIAHLPGRRGRVFRLSFAGYSSPEIALQLGISEAAVRQDLMNAGKEIKTMLGDCGGAAREERH